MICLKCDKDTFFTAPKLVEQEYKDRTFCVETPVKVCSHCGWFTVDLDQADTLLQNTKDTYLFELWWEENYAHMVEMEAETKSVLTKNIIGVTKVVAKKAWIAALRAAPCQDCK